MRRSRPRRPPTCPRFRQAPEERRNLIAYLSSLGGVEPGAIKRDAMPRFPPKQSNAVMHPKSGEWPTYNGVLGGNRHSPLNQINAGNVQNLQMQWVYSLNARDLETTPIVSDGVDVCHARPIMSAPSAPPRAVNSGATIIPGRPPMARARNPGGHEPGRGAAGRPHLLRHHRRPSDLPEPADRRPDVGCQHGAVARVRYGSSSAPLVVGDLVIAGVSGGDSPLLGFLAAYKATTGEAGLALPHGAQARRAGRRNLEGHAPWPSAAAPPG